MFYFCEDFTHLLENVLVTGSSPTALDKEPGSSRCWVRLFSRVIFPGTQLDISLQNFTLFLFCSFLLEEDSSPSLWNSPPQPAHTLSPWLRELPKTYHKHSQAKALWWSNQNPGQPLCTLRLPLMTSLTCPGNRQGSSRVWAKECDCWEESWTHLQFDRHCYSGITQFFNLDSFVLLLEQNPAILDYLFTAP